MFVHDDCRHYLGDRPCRFGRPCVGCPHYDPMGTRILIIKTAALGDVLRTTALLPGLKWHYPQSHITWLTGAGSAMELLRDNPLVDVLLPFGEASLIALSAQRFDLLVSLDKEAPPAAAAVRVEASRKVGFRLTPHGTLGIFNPESAYALALGLDNELKFFRNQKTYQGIIYEMVGLEYRGEEYIFGYPEADGERARARLAAQGAAEGDQLVALCPGAGSTFANKNWTPEGYSQLIGWLRSVHRTSVHRTRAPGVQVLLGGGPEDAPLLDRIAQRVGPPLLLSGTDNAIPQFAALLDRCALVVAGDSLPMHLAIALRKPVVAIFGPTCAQEVELYGRGEKVVTGIECSPCYKRRCDFAVTCMTAIGWERVARAVEAQLRSVDRRSVDRQLSRAQG
ncbi:MAG: glycosyltransferase family 9 protein, partial [Nitrospinota bacterium]